MFRELIITRKKISLLDTCPNNLGILKSKRHAKNLEYPSLAFPIGGILEGEA
jgi:hypothetical protein